MNALTITNPKGANVRIGAGTGAGIIRLAKAGKIFDYVVTIPYENGDIWAILTATDPDTARPWRQGNAQTAAFVAVYVGGVEYAKMTPGPDSDDYRRGYNAAMGEVNEFTAKMRK